MILFRSSRAYDDTAIFLVAPFPPALINKNPSYPFAATSVAGPGELGPPDAADIGP